MYVLDNELMNQIVESYEKNGFVHIQELISSDLVNYLLNTFKLAIETIKVNSEENILRIKEEPPELGDKHSIVSDVETRPSLGSYGNILSDSLLHLLTPFVSTIAARPLYPTYSYIRRYSKYQKLKTHLDRPENMHTMSIDIDICNSNDIWPLYIESNNKVEEINLKPTDIVLFKGQELKHWRNTLENKDESFHVYLAWSEKQMHLFDYRKFLSFPHVNSLQS